MKVYIKAIGIAAIVILAFVLLLHNHIHYDVFWENIGKNSVQNDDPDIVSLTRQDGTLENIELETYLIGVVGSEMPASYELEALKAQSVAARTFVMQRGMQVDDTTQTQVYHDEKQLKQIWGNNYEQYYKKVKEAVDATRGEVMKYDGKLISAVFFSSSCGKTANSEEYWKSKSPYLRSVDSSWDKTMDGYEQSVTISNQDFHKLLGFKNEVQEVGTPVYYDSGYVKSITIDRIPFTGREFREKLGLRSSSFTIAKTKEGYVITTKGYGHGLGMSQMGAQAMALSDKTYRDILLHYYTGVTICQK